MIPGPIALSANITATRPDIFRSWGIGGTEGQYFIRHNNVNYLYTTNTGQSEKTVQIFNADTGALYATFDTPGKAQSSASYDGNGNFYFESVNTLQRLNVPNKTLTQFGVSPANVESIMTTAIDYQGRLWLGTHSSKEAGAARVICVSASTGAEIARSPRLGTNNNYVQEMSISEDKKTLWCGTGNVTPRLFSVNVDNPSSPTQYTVPNCAANQSIRAQVRGNSVFVYHVNTSGTSVVSVLHIPTNTWTTLPHVPSGRGLTPIHNNKVYYAYLGNVFSFDPSDTTYTTTQVGTVSYLYTRNPFVLNNNLYMLEATKTHLKTHKIYLYNPSTSTSYENAIVQTPSLVQSMIIEPTTDTIYAGGYQGDGLCSTSIATGAIAHSIETVGISQIEGMMLDGRRLYMGSYGDAKIFTHTTTSPVTTSTSYRRLATLFPTYPQDRPFAWANTPDHVVFGTVPKPSYRGGALGVITKATNAVDVYTNLVPNHSIIDMTEDPNTPTTVYVTTSGRAGYGLDDYLGPAILFAFDVTTRTVIWSKEVPNSLELYGPVIMNNRMYVANQKTIWELDMLGNVLRDFDVFAYAGRAGWKNVELKRLPNSERLVHVSGELIRIFDPSTSQVSDLMTNRVLPHFDFDSQGNIWVVKDNGAVKLELSYPEPAGAIGTRYNSQGGVATFGYASTAETRISANNGVSQEFSRDGKTFIFYWSSLTGARYVAANTGIGGKFINGGGPATYGTPSTDDVSVSGGAYQKYRLGSTRWTIMWSSATGSHPIKISSAIGQAWTNAGEHNGWGFPSTSEYTFNGEVRQRFIRNGVTTTACWTSAKGVWTI